MCRLLHRSPARLTKGTGDQTKKLRAPHAVQYLRFFFAVITQRALSHSARAFIAPLGAASRFFVRSLCWPHSAVNSHRARRMNENKNKYSGATEERQCAGALCPKGLAEGNPVLNPIGTQPARLTEHNSINSHADGGRITKHFQFDGPWQ